MKIAIIAALDSEKSFLVGKLNNQSKTFFAKKEVFQGEINQHQVIVAESGIGKVNAAMVTTYLIENYRPDYLINIGSAGSLSNQLNIGDLIVADRLLYNDAFNQIFGYQKGQIPQEAEFFETDKKLRELVLLDQSIKTGMIVTGDSFVEQSNKKQILENFPQALATEMEGAAVAQVANKLEVPAMVIRCISDHADKKAETDFDQFVEVAGQKTSQVVIRLLSLL